MKYFFAVLFLISAISAFSQKEHEESTARFTAVFERGDLLTSTTGRFADGQLDKANTPYDDHVFAVYDANNGRTELTFIEKGIALVKYTDINGAIKKGDYLTSSSTPGAAMKATKSGMVIGLALEDAQPKQSSGLIKVRILVQYVKMN